ncbi:MAG: PAS domain-containing protein [Alphaproteobacteria bacterium]
MPTGRLRAVERSLDTIEEKPLAQLYAYWREAAAGRPFPLNVELRPERFAAALQHIGIIERAETPRAGLRIRLCGSDIENKDFGITRGAYIEDAQPPWYRDHLAPEIEAAMARVAPVYQRVETEMDEQKVAFARLLLPLTGDGRGGDMLLVAAIRPSDSIVSAIRARLTMA